MFKKNHAMALCALLASTSLLAQQPQKQKAGLIFDKPSFDKLVHKAPLSVRRTSPLPLEASVKAFAPPVTHQGSTNSCTGRSFAAALTIQEAQQRCMTSTAEIGKLFFSPTYIYGISRPQNVDDCEKALKFNDVIDAIQVKGIVRETNNKEVCLNHSIIQELEKKAFKKSVPILTTIFNPDSSGKTKRYLTKLALSNKNPVVIGMSSEGSFSEKTGEEDLWRLAGGSDNVGHAVCVVGYNKDKYGKNKGAFEILNSYGTEWGNKGYAWINDEDFEKYVYYGIEVPELQELPPMLPSKPQVEQKNPDIVVIPAIAPPSKPTNSKQILARVALVHEMDTFKLAQVDMKKLHPDPAFGARIQSRFRPIKVTKPVTTDDACQLLLDNDAATYVYVFSFDTQQAFNPLFPHPEFANMSPYLAAKNDITLPSENTEIVFDNHPGTEYICMLFSKTALDLGDIKSKFDNEKGNFFERLNNVLGKKLIAPNADKIKYGIIETDLNLHPERTIVPVVIEFNHI